MPSREHKYYYLLEVLLFSCLGCFSLFFFINSKDIPVRYQETFTTSQAYLAVIILFNGVGLSMMYIDRSIRSAYTRIVSSRKKMTEFMVICAVMLLAVNYLLLVSIKFIIDSPNPFRIESHGFRNLIIVWMIELVVFGLLMVNNFYRSLVSLYKKNAELEESAMKTQYQALQNQLNPHFLFNSLNTLISEIEYNPETAVQFTRNLSDVYRYILQCQDKKMVSLRSELDFMDSYIFLHKVRLGDCISVENNIGNSYDDAMVPPLTLQLIIENIIKHNVISRTKPMKVIISVDENTKYMSVSNCKRPKKEVVSSGKGLSNLRQRYRLLCGKSIVIEDTDDYFTIKVPLLNE